MISKPKHLHPIAILLFILKGLKDWIFLFISLFFLFGERQYFIYTIFGIVALIILITIFSWLKWLRFTYSVHEDALRIEHGIFIRKNRTISKHRIQSINLNQNILHRLLGLTGVQVETAGSDMEVDAHLIALKRTEAEQLRQDLKVSNGENDRDESYDYDYALEQRLPRYEASYKRLFIFGTTSGGFGLIATLFIFIFSEVEAFIPERFLDQTTDWIITQAVGTLIVLSILVLSVIWLIGVIGSVIKYGDFTIVRYEQELYITRGLWEKKQLTIPLQRIQAVGVKQNFLRLPFKVGSLFVVIAGGEVNQKENSRTIIFPLIRHSEIESFIKKMLPEYQYTFKQLKPISKKSFYYQSLANLLISIIPISLVLIFLPDFWWTTIILVSALIMYRYLSYKMTKTHLDTAQLTLQFFPFLSRETLLLKKDRIQALEQHQSLIQKKLKITNIKTSVLDNFVGQHYSIQGLPIKDFEKISDWYSYRDAYSLKDVGLDKN
ncbi:PH domain-containing protein [Amphibacillus sp. Q70]|uniref:PH domain-containing protein n=1 Tax=Amphibacillus sp. Q70 TaxID=3453416 RepID=UPI003F867617